MDRKRRLAAAWIACAVWMAVIFVLSAMPGKVSGEQSGMIMRLLKMLLPDNVTADTAAMAWFETLVRKAAHMTEYAVLLCLYRHALRLSGVRHAGRIAFALSVGYAVTDELHQAFVPDRGPSPVDVMIDSGGALIGWAAAWLFGKITRSYRQKSAQDGE